MVPAIAPNIVGPLSDALAVVSMSLGTVQLARHLQLHPKSKTRRYFISLIVLPIVSLKTTIPSTGEFLQLTSSVGMVIATTGIVLHANASNILDWSFIIGCIAPAMLILGVNVPAKADPFETKLRRAKYTLQYVHKTETR